MPRKKAEKHVDVFEKLSSLCCHLTETEKQLLGTHTTLQEYKKGEIIYHEGEHPLFLYCLLSGKVKVYKEGVGGRSQTIRLYKPVEYFGYRAFITEEDSLTAAAAFEHSLVAKIPLELIISFIKSNNALAWFFIQHLARLLGSSDERTVNLTQKHVRGRLAESLLFLKDHYGLEEDGCTLSIYLSREDLANLSNMTTSNAIRTLGSFASEKLIVIDGKKIKIINEAELQRISKLG